MTESLITLKSSHDIMETHLVVHECVESLPVALYLRSDVLILQDHASCSALAPLCGKIPVKSEQCFGMF